MARKPTYEELEKRVKDLERKAVERKRAEAQVTSKGTILTAINSVFKEALTCETEEELGKTCLAVAEELTGSEFGFIGELNHAGSYDTIAISNPGWDACKMPESDATKLLMNMPLRGIWTRPLKDGKSLILSDPSSHPDSVGTPGGHPPITSFLGVPLKHEGRTFGMFALGNKEGGYDVADQEAAEDLSVAIVEALRSKRTEEALRESEERYKTILRTTMEGFWIMDTKGRFLDMNKAYCDMSGYSREELLTMGVRDVETKSEEETAELMRNVMEVGHARFETRLRVKDGRIIHIEVLANYNKDEELFFGFFRDITERKQAQEGQEKLQAQLSNAVEMAHLGHWEYDVTNDLFTFNDHFYKIFRTTAKQVGGYIMSSAEYARRFVHPDDITVVGEETRKAVEATDPHFSRQLEHRMLYADGTVGHITVRFFIVKDAHGQTVKTYGVNQDITERKQVEEALRESEAEKRAILDGITTSMRLVNENMEMLWVNKAAAASVNKSPEEMIGRRCYEFWGDDPKKPCYGCPVTKTFRTKKTEQIIRHTPDEKLWDFRSEPVLDDKGNLAGVVQIAHDITDKSRLEAQLAQAQRMESIGTLAGGMAHNFNNLLMSIMGNASIMLSDIDPNHPHYENLRNIEESAKSGSRLTRQLLGYARKGRYEIRPINLNQLVEETSDTFGNTKKEITIHQELAKDLWAIKADHGQIEQVLLNLYVNAADAMPGGGDLFLKTMNVTHKDMLSKPYKPKPGDYVLLTVKDTGRGMDKKTKGRVFDPFFTTKDLAKGTGLGLASVYGIVKAHGGYIDVESKKGKGATFEIYLPATKREIKEDKESTGDIVKGKGTILLVDDEETIIDVGEQMLKKLGYEVYLAKSGQEAIDVYKENKDRIDMVLLDIVMPGMDGGRTYDSLREIDSDIKVLLSSGYDIEGKAKEILERGCDGFIQKPFNMRELSQKLKKILDS